MPRREERYTGIGKPTYGLGSSLITDLLASHFDKMVTYR